MKKYCIYFALKSLLCFLLIICVRTTVYADGSICLDILQNRWSPTYDVSSILTSIQVGYLCNYKPSLVIDYCAPEAAFFCLFNL